MNGEMPAIVQGVITPVNQTTMNGVATSRSDLHAVHAFLHKEIVTGATRSTAGALKDPPVINWKGASVTIPADKNTVEITPEPLIELWLIMDPLPPPNQHRDPEY